MSSQRRIKEVEEEVRMLNKKLQVEAVKDQVDQVEQVCLNVVIVTTLVVFIAV